MDWRRIRDALRARGRALLGRRQDDTDIQDELQFHLAMQTRANLQRGMPDHEAERRARVALGGLAQTTQLARSVRPFRWLDRFWRDVRYALRSLRRAPGFTIVAVLTIGVAIGACTAMYSVVHGVTLRPLPYPSPDRLVHLWQLDQQRDQTQFSEANFHDLRAASSSFTAVALYSPGATAVTVGGEPLRVNVATVSRDFFDVFATEPAYGRRFAAAELTVNGPPSAVISDRFWRQHFGAGALSDTSLRVRGVPTAVVGVMPSRFDFPAGVDIWVPRERAAASPFRTAHNWRVVARLRSGLAIEAARAESTAIARRLKQELGDSTSMIDTSVVSLHEELVGGVRPVLMMLLASVGLLLVVAAASLANLLLVRSAARQRELAIRAALGAAGRSLLITLAAESIVLSAAGGALGVGLAYGALQVSTVASLPDVPRLAEVSLSWPVLAFAVAVTSATAVALSLLVAWRRRGPGVVEWLKESERGHTSGVSLRRLRNSVVVAQLAVSVVLLVGAGLLGRSLAGLLGQNLGFRTDGVLAVQTTMPRPSIMFTPDGVELADPASLPRQVAFNERAIERLRALPGVGAAGGINGFPLGAGYSNGTFLVIRGDEPPALREMMSLLNDPSRTGQAEFRVASAGYFTAMGIPIIRGRLFDERDTAEAPHVALISESLARTRWPADDPIGSRIQFGGMDGDTTPFTIVGVVGDIRERGFDSDPLPMFYADFRQRPLTTFDFYVVLQTSVPANSVIAGARRILAEMAPEMPPRFRTVREALDVSTASRRFTLGLIAFFAGAALLLALLGVYGVLSYLVEQRRREFGVRLALGAEPSDVAGLVMGEAARLVTIGLAIGIGASLMLGRVLERVLFGVGPTDVATYLGVALVIGISALVSGQLPARRATRVNPVSVLQDH